MLISARLTAGSLVLALFGSALVLILAVYGSTPAFPELGGHFLIDVEKHGEAWFVLSENGKRVSLGAPIDMLRRLRAIGKPVTSDAIERIPEAGSVFAQLTGAGVTQTGKKYRGMILIRSDRAPFDAWYVHPESGIRYPLATPSDAWRLITTVAVGISAKNIADIPQLTLEEDTHPIFFEAVPSSKQTLIPGRADESISRETMARLDEFAKDQSRRAALRDGYIFLAIDNAVALVAPRYGRWFIIAPLKSGESFRVIDVIDGGGAYSAIDEKAQEYNANIRVYGLYTSQAEAHESLTFLIQQGTQIGTLAVDIVGIKTLYPTIDAVSLILLGGWRSAFFPGPLITDGAAVYALHRSELARIAGADVSTLQRWSTRDGTMVFGDRSGLFATDYAGDAYRITIDDPSTLSLRFFADHTIHSLADASGRFYIDAQNGRISHASSAYGEHARRIADDIVEINGGIYIESSYARSPIPLEGVDAASFFALPHSTDTLYSDGRTLYFRTRPNPAPNLVPLSSLDTASFEYLAQTPQNIIIKDRFGVFLVSFDTGTVVRVSNADSASFRLLYAEGEILIAKDASRVYIGPQLAPMQDADAASFHLVFTVEGIPFGRDQYSIYYALPKTPNTLYRLTGADPRTFQLKTLPTVEPALEGLTYQNSNLLVYAHDDKWIWLYDNAHDGLTIIRRANRDEKITQENILSFARMYATFFP